MLSSFKIKSLYGNYKVNFINSFKSSIKKNNNINAFYLIDQKIYNLHKKFFKKNINKNLILLKANENTKSIEESINIIKKLLIKNIQKDSEIIIIGGGVLQDVGAFASSLLFRGINYSFYPTTLLSQCDSCIGSKTSININNYKNLIGNFWSPKNIYIDTSFLKSLSNQEIKSGIGEMIHYFIYDNSFLFNKIIKNYNQVFHNRSLLKEYILGSLKIKKSVIEIDEFDLNERRKFNYGHTFGHALETLTNYKISHGQAVTIGMDLSNFISFHYGFIDAKDYYYNNNLLKLNMPKIKLNTYDINLYIKALRKDKKNKNKKLGCILLNKNKKLQLTYISFNLKLFKNIQTYFNNF